MKIKITSYTDNGKEIISRTFDLDTYDSKVMHSNLDNFIFDSEDYEQEIEHEHADSVDADGTCLECGKTNLI